MAALGACVRRLKSAVERPELLLSVQDRLASEFTALTKELYDFQKTQEADGAAGSPLKELVVEQFDEEQIWQEIELQNHSVLNYLKGAVAFLHRDSLSRLNGMEEAAIDSPAEELEIEDDHELEESSDEEKDLKSREVSAQKYLSEELSDEDSDINFDIDELATRTKLKKKIPKHQSSELDDKFFKLSEMEAFLENAEKEEANVESYDEINYFEDIPSEDEEIVKTKIKKKTKSSRNLKYKDYFDPTECQEPVIKDGKAAKQKLKPEKFGNNQDRDEDQEQIKRGREANGAYKKVRFDLSDDDDEEDDLATVTERKKLEEEKSNFEKRQEKLRAQIEQLEKSALEQKPWQLLGEATAQKRPENSLLEEDLLFDHTVRKAPVITEETTLQLEDVIIQRIKDQAWDDVLRKGKPKEETFEYKKRLTLDHEKSKLSLAEVYEQEYQKQIQQRTEVDENQQYTEIQKAMNSLFLKLDALCNFQFTPKPPVPELKIISNLPSISMEEVAPVNVSEATLLAPEEIKEKGRAGVLQGENEKTPTDKKRERRQKKKLKHLRLRAKEMRQKSLEKQNVKLSNKEEKKMNVQKAKKLAQQGKVLLLKDEGKDKTLRSSKAFFSHLQDQVKAELSGVKAAGKKKNKLGKLSANKLKL